MSKPATLKALCLMVLAGACVGCASQATQANPTSGRSLTIAQVLADAPRLSEQVVTIKGRYAGWWGKCQGGPPMSRSDWMLEDEKGTCLYVHGPFPSGIARPPSQASVGTPLELRGMLKIGPQGQPYLSLPRGEN